MAKELSQKIQAFKKLLKIAEEGSFDLYATSGDIYGERSWPVDCFKPLQELKYSKSKTRQQALDETLMKLTWGDFPTTAPKMKKQQEIIHLTLKAGANPNYADWCSGSVFDAFWNPNKGDLKGFGLLEVVKDERFLPPKKLQEFYENFSWYPVYYFSKEEVALGRQENAHRSDLIYTLFRKNMYPTDFKIFKKLSAVVLEKDPQFFDKKKKEMQQLLGKAKTPEQTYAVLMGMTQACASSKAKTPEPIQATLMRKRKERN